MTSDQIEKALGQIAWGGRHIQVSDMEGDQQILILHPPGLKDRRFVDFIYEKANEEAANRGVLSKFEMMNKLKYKNIWTPENDQEMAQLAADISSLEASSSELKKVSREYKTAQRQIESWRGRLKRLQGQRYSFFSNTTESYAEEMRSLALVFTSTYDEQDKRLWNSWKEFLSSGDDVLIRNIIRELNTTEILEVAEIREIARSNQWRFRWNGAKDIGDLFGKSISEFSPEQQGLLYWSQVYDSVFESPERPSDDIVNDDKALDDWFKSQDQKRKVESVVNSKEKTSKGTRLSKSMARHGEIFFVTNPEINPFAPKIEEVDALNTSIIRQFKQKEVEKIQENGEMNEKDLRDRRNKIARKIISSSDAVLGKNAFGQMKGGKSAAKILPGGTL